MQLRGLSVPPPGIPGSVVCWTNAWRFQCYGNWDCWNCARNSWALPRSNTIPPLEVSKTIGCADFWLQGFWLLWKDVVSILESIAKKLLFEKWRLRSKNFAFIMWCFFCTPFWEKEICYREDAPQHAYNSWGAWLSLLGLWRGRGLYSQDRDHSKQP